MTDEAFRESLLLEVKEAEERVARLERDEYDADERCRLTSLNDPDLQGYRDRSLDLSSKREHAQLALEKARRDLQLFG